MKHTANAEKDNGKQQEETEMPCWPYPKVCLHFSWISSWKIQRSWGDGGFLAKLKTWQNGNMLLFICLREPNQKNALGLWTASEKNWLYWRFLCAPTLALKKHCSSGTKQVTKIRHKKQKWSEKLHIKQMATWPRMAAWFHKTKGSSPRCRVYCLMEFAEDCIQASEAVKVTLLCWNTTGAAKPIEGISRFKNYADLAKFIYQIVKCCQHNRAPVNQVLLQILLANGVAKKPFSGLRTTSSVCLHSGSVTRFYDFYLFTFTWYNVWGLYGKVYQYLWGTTRFKRW